MTKSNYLEYVVYTQYLCFISPCGYLLHHGTTCTLRRVSTRQGLPDTDHGWGWAPCVGSVFVLRRFCVVSANEYHPSRKALSLSPNTALSPARKTHGDSRVVSTSNSCRPALYNREGRSVDAVITVHLCAWRAWSRPPFSLAKREAANSCTIG